MLGIWRAFSVRATDDVAQRQEAADWYESSPGAGEFDRFSHDPCLHARRDIAADADFECCKDFNRFVGIGDHDHRYRAKFQHEVRQICSDVPVGYFLR